MSAKVKRPSSVRVTAIRSRALRASQAESNKRRAPRQSGTYGERSVSPFEHAEPLSGRVRAKLGRSLPPRLVPMRRAYESVTRCSALGLARIPTAKPFPRCWSKRFSRVGGGDGLRAKWGAEEMRAGRRAHLRVHGLVGRGELLAKTLYNVTRDHPGCGRAREGGALEGRSDA